MQKPNCSESSLVKTLKNAEVYTEKVQAALQIAIKTHCNQRRDDNQPYLEQHVYPIAVEVATTFSEKERENAVIVALLHDVLEDHPPCTLLTLQDTFGKDTAADIVALQKKRSTALVRDQAVKHMEHKEYSKQIASASRLVKMVKTIDRLNNLLCTEGYRNKEKYRRFLQDTTELYLPIASEFGTVYTARMKQEIARIEQEIYSETVV